MADKKRERHQLEQVEYSLGEVSITSPRKRTKSSEPQISSTVNHHVIPEDADNAQAIENFNKVRFYLRSSTSLLDVTQALDLDKVFNKEDIAQMQAFIGWTGKSSSSSSSSNYYQNLERFASGHSGTYTPPLKATPLKTVPTGDNDLMEEDPPVSKSEEVPITPGPQEEDINYSCSDSEGEDQEGKEIDKSSQFKSRCAAIEEKGPSRRSLLACSDSEKAFRIYCKFFWTAMDSTVYYVSSGMTVEVFRRSISTREKMGIDQIRLIYGGKQMEDALTIGHYGIQENSQIHVVGRLRGD